jgi:hypothetical protein
VAEKGTQVATERSSVCPDTLGSRAETRVQLQAPRDGQALIGLRVLKDHPGPPGLPGEGRVLAQAPDVARAAPRKPSRISTVVVFPAPSRAEEGERLAPADP